MSADNLCFYGTYNDKDYLTVLKGCVGGTTCFIRLEKVSTLTEVQIYCNKKAVSRVVSTSQPLLAKLLAKRGWSSKKSPAISNYAGSVFTIEPSAMCPHAIQVVFVHPLKNTFTVTYGRFLLKRYISKLVRPSIWPQPIPFKWSIIQPETYQEAYDYLADSFLVAIDIETFRDKAQIRCVNFCGFHYEADGTISCHSYVLPLDSEYNLEILRQLCWELKAPKVFQGGKYDAAYLLRYGAPVYNYLYDTANMFHAWYSELPKDLGSLNSFFIKNSMYWKDLAETNDLHEYYRYNALDGWGTGVCLINMLLEMPKWAKDNYLLEFPNAFPCILAEMTGMERDMGRLEQSASEIQAKDDANTASLRNILGEPFFNPGSSKQVCNLLKLLGCKDITSSDEKSITKARFRHPFISRVLGYIATSRKDRKLLTTYLTVGEKAKEFHRLDGTGNRILYALVPEGTDTSRLASRESPFWCGLQIQNIPRGKLVKQTMKADPGFAFCEVDLSQAESRDTAYISADATLIDAVENSPDFHSSNAAMFFGVPFEEIYDEVNKLVLNKPLRQLAKPVNHGANYNMGEYMLVLTMGEEKILEAKNLLKLPRSWTLKQVASYLLTQFHRTYPGIKGTMYKEIIAEIERTKMLRSTALHYHSDIDTYEEVYAKTPAWSRYCFGNPTKNKRLLNSYIAHPPQSLNAQTLNKAWIAVFHRIAINPKYSANFKLIAQIHDSILFQYRIGHEYVCEEVRKLMEIPITLKGYDGKIRTFTVPAETKNGDPANGKPALYWSECE